VTGTLDGLRVLDLSRVLAGPWCTQLLADLGADVIKVERPGRGDDTRQWGPHWLKNSDGTDGTESSYYLAANRNKRSVTINIGVSEGRQIVADLARDSDVLVENFKVGGLESKGLDYETLRKVNPRLVYASITGFGQDGPRSADPGYDYLAQALSGFMSVTGDPEGPPVRAGVAVSDLSTGMYTTVAVLAALVRRSVSGVGQHIDVALLDTQTAMLANQASSFLVSGVAPERSGPWHPSLAPYQTFDAADDTFIIACGNDTQFRTLCSVIGRPELADDPRFVENPGRVLHRAELAGEMTVALLTKPRAHWLKVLPEAGVPAGSVNTIAEAFDEPQLQHRGIRVDLPHPTAGTAPGVANPIKFSESPVEYRSAPPLLGQHTDEVLGEVLGLDAERIGQLRVSGAIGPPPQI
jgi:crotonobetainyl-CoA:carnitine CoA-transferase CaiB-like acyl-CoA transferase